MPHAYQIRTSQKYRHCLLILNETLQHSLALGPVQGGRARMGEELYAPMPNAVHPARVVAPVFYDPDGEYLSIWTIEATLKPIGPLEDASFDVGAGPDEWLLMAPEKSSTEIVSQLANLGKTTTHSLIDVSHRTNGIEISGPLATLALNIGCPLDLGNMPDGRCARSILDKAEITLMKLEEQHYRLEIVRSFTPFVWDFQKKAGI